MKRHFHLFISGLILVIVMPVYARGTKAMLKQAQQLFTEAKYQESLKILQDVYKIMPRPLLRWNMGRCMEAMKDYEGALKEYQEVLLIKKLSAKQQTRVRQGIERVKRLWVKQMMLRSGKMVKKGDVKAGQALYSKAWLISQDNDVLKTEAEILQKNGNYMAAIMVYKGFIAATDDKGKKLAATDKIRKIKLIFQKKLLKNADFRAKKHDLTKAMTLLDQAYELRGDPYCLWKKAGIYKDAGDRAKAIQTYEAYIALKPGAKMVSVAKDRIAALQPQKKVVPVIIARVLPQKRSSGKALMTGGYILAGTAVAAIATGVAFTLLANRDYSALRDAGQDKLDRVIGMDQERAAGLQSTAGTERTVSWVMYGVGAAMAVTSVALIVTGHKKAKVSAFAAPTKRGMSLGFQTRF